MSTAPPKCQKYWAGMKGKSWKATPVKLSDSELASEQAPSKTRKKPLTCTKEKDTGVLFAANPPSISPILARSLDWYKCTPEELVHFLLLHLHFHLIFYSHPSHSSGIDKINCGFHGMNNKSGACDLAHRAHCTFAAQPKDRNCHRERAALLGEGAASSMCPFLVLLFLCFLCPPFVLLDLVCSYNTIASASNQAHALFLALEDVLKHCTVKVEWIYCIVAYMDANKGREHFQAAFNDNVSIDEVIAALKGLIPTIRNFKHQWQFGSERPTNSGALLLPPPAVDTDAKGEEDGSSGGDELFDDDVTMVDPTPGDMPVSGPAGPPVEVAAPTPA
jgi:hypothetical protein